MRLEEQQWRNKRQIRVKVFGRIDPTTGAQVVEFRARYEANVYVVSYTFPPDLEQELSLTPFVPYGLRRAWRCLREGLRKKMHGDNFRARWAIARQKRIELENWDRFQAPLVPIVSRRRERERFVGSLEERVGATPPYIGHDYSRRVREERGH